MLVPADIQRLSTERAVHDSGIVWPLGAAVVFPHRFEFPHRMRLIPSWSFTSRRRMATHPDRHASSERIRVLEHRTEGQKVCARQEMDVEFLPAFATAMRQGPPFAWH